jgi:3',5'-cyclic AMP phosphodiesterase CpdA
LDDLKRTDVKVDLVAVTGDLIDSSVADNLGWHGVLKALRNVKTYLLNQLCPAIKVDPQTAMLVVPGNHDFRLKGLLWKESQFDLFYKEFQEYFGPRLFQELRLCLFTFDSNSPDRALNFATGLVQENDLIEHHGQVDQIAQEHGEFWRASTRVVLLHHHPMPIAPTQHREEMKAGEEFMLLKNAGLFMEQMVKTKMDLVLHGHRHYPAYSRVSFPTSEGAQHEIAIVAAGSVGKHDDHAFSYNLITVTRSGELLLERRVLTGAVYEQDKLVTISNYEAARNKRCAGQKRSSRQLIRAHKYVRVDTIRASSGDVVIDETFYGAQSLGETPISSIPRVMTSRSGVFGTWTYEAPPGHKIEWEWSGPPAGAERKGRTTLKPPLGKAPLTFSRRGTTFNAIHFNQKDRLDATDQKVSEEWTTLNTIHVYDAAVLQVSFPPTAFPSDFRLEVTCPDGKTPDFQEEEFLRPRLTRFSSTSSVILVLPQPLPEYSYRIVWDLPADEIEELNLSAVERGLAVDIGQRLLDLREPGSPHRTQVEQSLLNLRKQILSGPTYRSAVKDDRLEVELFVYSAQVGGLVCAATLSDHGRDLSSWVVKPGRFVVGQAFRRRAEVLLINLRGVGSEAASYYEPVPGLEDLPPHTVVFSIPLFYPVRSGSKVGALSLGSRSHTSGLLCLQKDRAALLALKEQVLNWYATELARALDLTALL